MDDDLKNELVDFAGLRQQLEEIKRSSDNELLLRPIENWMREKLGVVRLPNRGGSAVTFQHPVLKKYRGSDRFGVHVKKRTRTREKIRKRDFDYFLYKPLVFIIDALEMEANNAE